MLSPQCAGPALLLCNAVLLLQVGISLNYNKVYGWIDFDTISPEYISKTFDKEWKAQAKNYPMDLQGMKQLYQAVDVIGVSGTLHAPCSSQCTTCGCSQCLDIVHLHSAMDGTLLHRKARTDLLVGTTAKPMPLSTAPAAQLPCCVTLS